MFTVSAERTLLLTAAEDTDPKETIVSGIAVAGHAFPDAKHGLGLAAPSFLARRFAAAELILADGLPNGPLRADAFAALHRATGADQRRRGR